MATPRGAVAIWGLALFGAFLLLRRESGSLEFHSQAAWLLLAYLVWCGMSILWSEDRSLTLRHFSVLVLCSIGALGVAQTVRPRRALPDYLRGRGHSHRQRRAHRNRLGDLSAFLPGIPLRRHGASESPGALLRHDGLSGRLPRTRRSAKEDVLLAGMCRGHRFASIDKIQNRLRGTSGRLARLRLLEDLLSRKAMLAAGAFH